MDYNAKIQLIINIKNDIIEGAVQLIDVNTELANIAMSVPLNTLINMGCDKCNKMTWWSRTDKGRCLYCSDCDYEFLYVKTREDDIYDNYESYHSDCHGYGGHSIEDYYYNGYSQEFINEYMQECARDCMSNISDESVISEESDINNCGE